MKVSETADYNKAQHQVLLMSAIRPFRVLLCISAVLLSNSWGFFYLEAEKGHSTLDASFIVSINSVFDIIGTMFSGLISNKLFGGQRNVPALIFGFDECACALSVSSNAGQASLSRCDCNDFVWFQYRSVTLFLGA